MMIRTNSQFAKNARWLVSNRHTWKIEGLYLSREDAQSACDRLHSEACINDKKVWGVYRNPAFESDLPPGFDLTMLDN